MSSLNSQSVLWQAWYPEGLTSWTAPFLFSGWLSRGIPSWDINASLSMDGGRPAFICAEGAAVVAILRGGTPGEISLYAARLYTQGRIDVRRHLRENQTSLGDDDNR